MRPRRAGPTEDPTALEFCTEATDAAPEADSDDRGSRRWRPPVWQALLALVVVGVSAFAVVSAVRRPTGGSAPGAVTSGPSIRPVTLLDAVTHLDVAVMTTVRDGGVPDDVVQLKGAEHSLGAGGRPRILFVASEPCGACAAQRWSLMVALGRFGTLANMYVGASATSDQLPALATFSFRAAQYRSDYIDLVAVETTDSAGKALATLSPGDEQVFQQYTTPSASGGLPWLDIDNRYAVSGSGYDPQILRGLTAVQIGELLSIPRDPVAKAIVGGANWITAGICKVTGMKPASVCAAAPVAELIGRMP